MAITTYNKAPYFDDYKIPDSNLDNQTVFDKNYYRILFQPGYAVQNRELNQLQSLLQAQIDFFGASVYEPGSPIINGLTTFTDNIATVDLIISDNDAGNSFINFIDLQKFIEIRGLESTPEKITAEILSYKIFVEDNQEKYRLWVRYLNESENENKFPLNSDVYLFNDTLNLLNNDSTVISSPIGNVQSTGIGFSIHVEEGIFFINGTFVHTVKQDRFYSKSSASELITANVIFQIIELTIGSEEDQTLLDNAAGTPNFSAPGADRYTILLNLALQTDDEDILNLNSLNIFSTSESEENIQFVRLLTINQGSVFTEARTRYSQLDRVLAERTFEESGNYTVEPFLLASKELLKKDGNGGKYTIEQIESNNLFNLNDEAEQRGITLSELVDEYFFLEIEPSVAYVEGNRVDLAEKKGIPVKKARTFQQTSGVYLTYSRGNYIDVKYQKGQNLDINETMANLFETADVAQFVRNIEYISSDDNFIFYRVFVFNGFNNFNSNLSEELLSNFDYLEVNGVPDQTIKNPENNRSIYKLPYSPIKAIDPTAGIEYRKQKIYQGSFQGDRTYRFQDSRFQGIEIFTAVNAFDLILFRENGSDRKFIDPNDVESIELGSFLSVKFKSTVNLTPEDENEIVTAIIPVLVEDTTGGSLRKNKSVVTVDSETHLASPDLKITLDNEDVLISSIQVQNTSDPNDTNYTVLFNGQTENFYEKPVIRVSSESEYTVTYKFFNHEVNTADGLPGDYFSVDSYVNSGVDFSDIPKYRQEPLSNYIDFRVKRSESLTNYQTRIVPNSLGEISFDHYLPRYDLLVINSSDSEFKVIKGQPDINPRVPKRPKGTMSLYTLTVPGYTYNTNDIKLGYIDNRRYTMSDIGKLEKRISDLEYYSSLSLLEEETENRKILDINAETEGVERFKSGILVDSFIGHSVGDVTNPDYLCAIDKKDGILRPYYKQKNFRFKYQVPFSPIEGQQGGEQVNLWNGEKEVLFAQQKASLTLSVQPYEVVVWEGKLQLSPSSDEWFDTETRPTVTINQQGISDALEFIANEADGVLGTEWNAWQTNWQSTEQSVNQTLSDPHTALAPDGVLRQRVEEEVVIENKTGQSRDGLRTDLSFNTVEQNLGERVVDVSIVPFMRSRDVAFRGEGFKPNTKLYAFFDDENVTSFCSRTNNFRQYGFLNEANVYSGEEPPSPNSDGFNYGELFTDENGEIVGTFRVPNNSDLRFRTGQRTFTLTNSEVNDENERDTFAKTRYDARGLLQTKETRILSTRVPEFSQERVSQNRTIVNRTVSRNVRYQDPIAQTFAIGNNHPQGVFITDVDLYFASAPEDNIDVEVYIVSVENGIPTQEVVPGSRVIRKRSEVNVSGRTPNEGRNILNNATNFQFDYPVYLQSGFEYAIVVFSISLEYRVWVSELGQSDIVTNKPITKNPSFGVLLKSQNAKTWTPDQTRDLMMKMNKAVFDTNQSRQFNFSTRISSTNIQNMDLFDFSLFNLFFEELRLPETNINYRIQFLDQNGTSLLPSGTYSSVEIKENYNLRKQFSASNKPHEVFVTATMTTQNRDLTPVIDLERCSLIGISNFINNESDGEDSTDGGAAHSRYITRSVKLANPADEIRLILAINRPTINANIKAYAKRLSLDAVSESISDALWQEMSLLSVGNDRNVTQIPTQDNERDYIEAEFIIPNPDPNEGDSAVEFSEYAIKIVLLSSDITQVPKIRDLRAIATL